MRHVFEHLQEIKREGLKMFAAESLTKLHNYKVDILYKT